MIKHFTLWLFAFLSSTCLIAQPYESDPLFGGGNGYFLYNLNNGHSSIQSIRLLDNGKIIAFVKLNQNGRDSFVIARFHYTGRLDSSFGKNGMTKVKRHPNDEITCMEVSADGKIVIGGSSVSQGGGVKFMIQRLTAEGNIDSTLGGTGVIYPSAESNKNGECNAVVIQPDGKIVAGGWSFSGIVTTVPALIRFHPDGRKDSSFGYNGSRYIGNFSDGEIIRMKLRADGNIIFSGIHNYDLFIGSLMSNGIPDPDFQISTYNLGSFDYPCDMLVQSDGGVFVNSWTDRNSSVTKMGLIKLDSAGKPDPLIGAIGAKILEIGKVSTIPGEMVQLADGKIMMAGVIINNMLPNAILLRLDSKGVIDSSFSSDGIVIGDPVLFSDGYCVAARADGRLILGGKEMINSWYTAYLHQFRPYPLNVPSSAGDIPELNFYPNPANSRLTLNYSASGIHRNIRIELYTSAGAYISTIYEADLISAGSSKLELRLPENAPEGLLYLKFSSNQFIYTKKFIHLTR